MDPEQYFYYQVKSYFGTYMYMPRALISTSKLAIDLGLEHIMSDISKDRLFGGLSIECGLWLELGIQFA